MADQRLAVVGIGGTAYGNPEGYPVTSLHVEAAKNAMDDAGLNKRDIDGIIVCDHSPDVKTAYRTAEHMGMATWPKKFLTAVTNGGVAAAMANDLAAHALRTGEATNVLIVGGGSGRVRRRAQEAMAPTTPAQSYTDRVAGRGQETMSLEFDIPYGPFGVISFYGLAAQRHMYEYGTTAEQMAAVSVACRKHAYMNPRALKREPITIDDVINAPYICEPFHLLDCCLPAGGSDAYIITTEDRARDLRHPPIWMDGIGHAHSAYHSGLLCTRSDYGFDLIHQVGTVAAERAFGQAGVEPKDIDVAQLYDSFTMTVLMQLEDFGFAPKGEGGAFAEGGRIEHGGELPINTNGGMLSMGQSGVGSTVMFINEAVSQLRGDAGPMQVEGAKHALAGSVSGTMSNYGVTIFAAD